ncbi:MAG: glycosyl transferase family 51 [Alphaproteobacteria bacterium]|nr:glycosyl transferase family 51 [Alphaproteobacteria bacterium]
MRTPQPILVIFTVGFFVLLVAFSLWASDEMFYSRLQARHFSDKAAGMTFTLAEGPQENMFFPASGPYFQRLGYAFLPYFIKSLTANGFKIAQQAAVSEGFQKHVMAGGMPIYQPKNAAGLKIITEDGEEIFSNQYPNRLFQTFDDIPSLVTHTLLFIENRELLGEWPATRNPVIEWKRLGLAALSYAMGGLLDNAGGGSTLATQLEKFRFSAGGRTSGTTDKLRQIEGASLRVYQQGQETTAARRNIVLDYINATPLAARPGWGEVNGLGDGLLVWFGLELADVQRLLQAAEDSPASLRAKARVYRPVLALILAQRRPAFYLQSNRAALEELINETLANLRAGNIISPLLYEATLSERLKFSPKAPMPQAAPYIQQKAINAVRTKLLSSLGLQHLYELDRFDVTVEATLNMTVQKAASAFLQKLSDPQFVTEIGLRGERLLGDEADPTKVQWTLLLYERSEEGNKLRVQTDNQDQPLDLNDGTKLDLGSTAKLRTLITYLEIIAEIYERYVGIEAGSLEILRDQSMDYLTQWVAEYLMAWPDATLAEILAAAMERRYSANPGESFFTGGGLLSFNNFDKKDNGRMVTVNEAMQHSINLPFIRIMRDVVNYTIAQGPNTKKEILGDPEHPQRQAYLERFADKEGSVFMRRFHKMYQGMDKDKAFDKLAQRGRNTLSAQATIFRLIRTNHNFADFKQFMQARLPDLTVNLDDQDYRKLFLTYGRGKFSLADQGYIAGVHPLEIWQVAYQQTSEPQDLKTVMEKSRSARLASYAWLFNTRHKSAQDTRIRILLEQDAFATIHQRWVRLGYPFQKLTASYGTAIGSSGDRPGALAELMGILMNDGVRLPMLRYQKLDFAAGTPFQTVITPDATQAEQVLAPEIAATARQALKDVVTGGTAQRLNGIYYNEKGEPATVGGKTGTGDHRYQEFGRGGRLLSSRVVSRTATFVFFLGDQFFGVVTAYVAGEEAGKYHFTSALPTQMLKALAPVLQPMLTPALGNAPPHVMDQDDEAGNAEGAARDTESVEESAMPDEVEPGDVVPNDAINGDETPRDNNSHGANDVSETEEALDTETGAEEIPPADDQTTETIDDTAL